ncbi:MAG TPA: LytTR family DNA-binding domain-containing protein [Thermoanaerobaculia bacterium]|nr:LytTR family DNA-binding domain-containing protein [Thermoanaerobaculia bacterium]
MSEPLRVLVVDDEPLARDGIRALLEADAEVAVVGEATGSDAAALVARTRPDILFLDIQMPEVDGFALLEQIGADAVPAVVFVTAFDRYALKAFEVHALDYLLKPFDDRRFAGALEHAKERARARRRGEVDARIAELLADRASAGISRFLIPVREKTIVVNAAEIDWIEAADYYVSLHVAGTSHLLRRTMDEIEKQLDPRQFFRVHRSAIVNVDRVREIHPLFRGDCALVLSSGQRVKLSRSRRAEFEALFAKR